MVVVSAGFHKTHETIAAQEASDRRLLDLCITGAYPTERFKRVAQLLRLADKGRIARVMDRGERIPSAGLRSLFVPEMLDEASRLLTPIPVLGRAHPALSAATWRLYGAIAARNLDRANGARIFHFRAGFGQASVQRAKDLGMVTLCDRSLVHPSLVAELIERRGELAAKADDGPTQPTDSAARDPLTRAILADVNRADAVVVNSDFVKQTFLAMGWPAERVHVVYLGVDDNFLRGAAPPTRELSGGPLRLLFAGRLEVRKGVEVLFEALRDLDDIDWELSIAGPVAPEIRAAHNSFLKDHRVQLLGNLRRAELRKRMLAAPVLVFPSFAEGSARVVFEAMACGCYVITTPNSGTIVQDGVHGALVPPGDVERLRTAIGRADADRSMLAEVGNRNAHLVADRYRQADYGDALEALYRKLAVAAPRNSA